MRGKAKGTALIEGVQQSGSNSVVNDTEAAPDHGLVLASEYVFEPPAFRTRRIGKSEARREVLVVPVVVAGLVITTAGEIEGDRGIRGGADTLQHVRPAQLEPVSQSHGRCYLRPAGFPRRREE